MPSSHCPVEAISSPVSLQQHERAGGGEGERSGGSLGAAIAIAGHRAESEKPVSKRTERIRATASEAREAKGARKSLAVLKPPLNAPTC